MRKVIRATPLYKFLRCCNDSPLDKTVLDCGAGGDDPPLQLFHEYGYKTFGIEISDDSLNEARKFCMEHSLRLSMFKGDMKKLPFKDETFSFVYSYNTLPLRARSSTWSVTHIRVGLMDSMLQPLDLTLEKKPSGKYVEILIPTETVEMVADLIVLNKTIEELKKDIELATQ